MLLSALLGAFPDVQAVYSIATNSRPYHQKCRRLNLMLKSNINSLVTAEGFWMLQPMQ